MFACLQNRIKKQDIFNQKQFEKLVSKVATPIFATANTMFNWKEVYDDKMESEEETQQTRPYLQLPQISFYHAFKLQTQQWPPR